METQPTQPTPPTWTTTDAVWYYLIHGRHHGRYMNFAFYYKFTPEMYY